MPTRTLYDNGVLLGAGASAPPKSVVAMSDNQILIGHTGKPPAPGNVTDLPGIIAINASLAALVARVTALETLTTTHTSQIATLQGQVATLEEFGRGARVTHSASQNVPPGVNVLLSFDTVRFDTDTMYSAGSPTRLTFNKPGKYLMGASVAWDVDNTGNRELFIAVNGLAAMVTSSFQLSPSASGGAEQTVTGCYDVAAGGYLEAYVFQDTAGTRQIMSAVDWSPVLWAIQVGP